MSAYTHNGGPRMSAIWCQRGRAPMYARHGLSSAQYQAEFDSQLGNGFLLGAVTGYADGNQARFAALWSR